MSALRKGFMWGFLALAALAWLLALIGLAGAQSTCECAFAMAACCALLCAA